MNDIVLPHAAERDGAIQPSREFDMMRDRVEWMRSHPDLAATERNVLQVAAQLSVVNRDRAEVYSTEQVDRLRKIWPR